MRTTMEKKGKILRGMIFKKSNVKIRKDPPLTFRQQVTRINRIIIIIVIIIILKVIWF